MACTRLGLLGRKHLRALAGHAALRQPEHACSSARLPSCREAHTDKLRTDSGMPGFWCVCFAGQEGSAAQPVCVHGTAQGEYTLLESAEVLMQERRAPALIYRRVPADIAGAGLSAARAQAAVLFQVGLARLAVVRGVLASAGYAPASVGGRGSPGRPAGAFKAGSRLQRS